MANNLINFINMWKLSYKLKSFYEVSKSPIVSGSRYYLHFFLMSCSAIDKASFEFWDNDFISFVYNRSHFNRQAKI